MKFTFQLPRFLALAAAIAASIQCLNSATAAGPTTTLSQPDTPFKLPGADGFLQRWLVLEPITTVGLTENAVQAAVHKEYFPDQFTVIPRDRQKVRLNGLELTWHAEDTNRYNLDLYHFARNFNKASSNVLFWAVTIVNCPEELKNVRLAIGSNAASVWWVNGKEVIGIYGDRQTVIDDGVSKKLTLKKGPNVVRAAIVNGGGATDFCARFLDSEDKPIRNITVSLAVSSTPPEPTASARGTGSSGQEKPTTNHR